MLDRMMSWIFVDGCAALESGTDVEEISKAVKDKQQANH